MKKITNSPQETEKFAENFARGIKPGDVIALYGNLGAGKTVFTKGLAKGLGIKKKITSPTFVFLKTYKTNNTVVNHVDLYRGGKLTDFKDLGMDEIFSKNAITIVEWPERLKGKLPKKRIDIFIDTINENSRSITIKKH